MTINKIFAHNSYFDILDTVPVRCNTHCPLQLGLCTFPKYCAETCGLVHNADIQRGPLTDRVVRRRANLPSNMNNGGNHPQKMSVDITAPQGRQHCDTPIKCASSVIQTSIVCASRRVMIVGVVVHCFASICHCNGAATTPSVALLLLHKARPCRNSP